jgi:arsenate reductase
MTIAHYLISFFIAIPALLPQDNKKVVLFVCEHGSAKSIVAAAYFQKMAAKEGLQVKTISRGTNPDEIVPEKINQILTEDGFARHSAKPEKLVQKDLNAADYVVMFSSFPPDLTKPGQVENWNIPSFEGGYPIARDSIVINVERLIQKIKNHK